MPSGLCGSRRGISKRTDFGRGLNAWVVMQNAAREGAFYAAKVCTYASSCSNVTTVVETEAAPVLNSATVSNLAVTGPCAVDGQLERTAEVKVSFNFNLVTPFFGANASLPMTVVATAPEGPGTASGSSGGSC